LTSSGVRPADVVRAVGDLDDGEVRDQLLIPEPGGGRLEREDAVGGPVDDQRGHVDLGQIVPEVGQPRIDARVRRVRPRSGGHLELARSAASPIRSGASTSVL
jgi:hypothetical protein